MGSQCHTESQETSWWQLGSPTPPLCHSSALMTCEVRNWLPPTGEGSTLQWRFKKCPSQFSALFILQPSWKQPSLFDFPQSENCLHRVFLKCRVDSAWGSSPACSRIRREKNPKQNTKYKPGQYKCACVSLSVCVGEHYTSLLEGNKSLEWFLGRGVLLIAKRWMSGLEWITLWCNGKLKGR